MNVTRRAKIAAATRAADILTKIIELREPLERRWSGVAKRHAALMCEFDRHSEAYLRAPNTREIDAAMAAMDAASRLIERFESAAARTDGQEAKLLEELRQVFRITEARERARLVATFSFWLQKTKRRT